MLKKVASGSVGLLLLIAPLTVSADLMSDLQAQIQALLAQIAQLQGQSPPPPTPSYPGDDFPSGTPPGQICPGLSVTMQRGSRDATTSGQVSELQIFLANRYNLNDDDVVTGYFGATTQTYVMKFQKEQGLPTYGIVGSLTRAAIARECGGGSIVATPEIKIAATPALVPKGSASVVAWSASNATRCWMTSGPLDNVTYEETVALQGQKQFNPYVAFKVTVSCANEPQFPKDGPHNSASVIINVVPEFVEINERCTGYSFTQNHQKGDIGSDVYEIHRFLNILGKEGTDRYDDTTVKHVDIFQRKYNLPVGEVNAGVWEAATRAKANAINASCESTKSALNVSTSPGTPESANVIAGTTNVLVGRFDFRATGSAYTVQELKVKIPSDAATSVTAVTLKYKNQAGVVQTVSQSLVLPVGSQTHGVATFTGLSFYIPPDSSQDLGVYVNIPTIAAGAKSGAAISVLLDADEGFKAIDSSGTADTSLASSDVNSASRPGIGIMYVRKSVPTVAQIFLTGPLVSGSNVLLKFSITADAAGPIDIGKMTFRIDVVNTTASTLDVYDVTGTSQHLGGASQMPNPTGNLILAPASPVQISAGATRTFEVRGAVSSMGERAAYSTMLLEDPGPSSMTTRDTAVGAFVWSDRSASAHSEATNDWTNGYGLRTLPISQGRTGSATTPNPVSLSNGAECTSLTQCQSGYCYPGPENKSYCIAKEMNCAKPGTSGIIFGDSYVFNSKDTYACVAGQGLVRYAMSRSIPDGYACITGALCASGYCYPGPGQHLCISRDANCARPETSGVNFGESYTWSGKTYQCQSGSGLTGPDVASSQSNSNLANALMALEGALQSILKLLGQ